MPREVDSATLPFITQCRRHLEEVVQEMRNLERCTLSDVRAGNATLPDTMRLRGETLSGLLTQAATRAEYLKNVTTDALPRHISTEEQRYQVTELLMQLKQLDRQIVTAQGSSRVYLQQRRETIVRRLKEQSVPIPLPPQP